MPLPRQRGGSGDAELTNAAADQIAPWMRDLVELAAALHNLHSALWHSAEAEGIPLQGSHNNNN